MNCPEVILIPGYLREETTGRGFNRRTICVYVCPKCGAVHRSQKNWHGPAPRGGFVCNREVKS